MPFIGNQPADKFLTLEKQVFTTSATDTYSLDREVSSVNDIELFLNNVRQEPTEAYTISGTTLTLASAITSSDSMYCIYQGRAVGTQSPAVGSVTNDMLAGSIATSKLADITANGITMANQWRLTTSFAVSGTTDITSNIESIDSDSAGSIGSLMTQSSGVFTFPSTGVYLVIFNMYINYNGTSPIYYCENYIQVSTDGGSSFGVAAANASSLNGDVRNGSAITLHLLDVTDTSLIKVKFQAASSSTPQVVGDTNASHTSFTFIRLGDT